MTKQQRSLVLQLLLEGNSPKSASQITGLHRDTIAQQMVPFRRRRAKGKAKRRFRAEE